MSADSWIAGFAIGLMLAFGFAIHDYLAGQMSGFTFYLLLIGAGTSTAPALEGLFKGTVGLIVHWRDSFPPRAKPSPAPPPPAAVTISRPVIYRAGGETRTLELEETRDARWTLWQEAAWRVLAWYDLRGSLSARKLTPGVFTDPAAWVRMTDALRDAGLVLKSDQSTAWRYTPAHIRAQLEGGRLTWPTDADPPRITPPPHAPVTLDGTAGLTQTEA